MKKTSVDDQMKCVMVVVLVVVVMINSITTKRTQKRQESTFDTKRMEKEGRVCAFVCADVREPAKLLSAGSLARLA